MNDRRRVPGAGRLAAPALVLGLGLWSSSAGAHIELLTPTARYPAGQQKGQPCGDPANPPGTGTVATYAPGQTITIEFNEFVDHRSHYRIALDPTGTDAFTSPAGFDDFYNSPQVLLDDIADDQDGLHTLEVTLPDVTCNPCTLQLIQVMTDDGAWGPDTDDLYFQCADIVIDAAAATGGGGPGDGGTVDGGGQVITTGADESGDGMATTDDDDEGCGCRSSGPGGTRPAPYLLVVPWLVRRRRGRSARR